MANRKTSSLNAPCALWEARVEETGGQLPSPSLVIQISDNEESQENAASIEPDPGPDDAVLDRGTLAHNISNDSRGFNLSQQQGTYVNQLYVYRFSDNLRCCFIQIEYTRDSRWRRRGRCDFATSFKTKN